VAVGWTGVDHRVQAISIAAVVAVATATPAIHPQTEDRVPGRRHAASPADRHPGGRARLGAGGGVDLTLLNRAHTYPIPEPSAFSAQALAPATGRTARRSRSCPKRMSRFRIAASDRWTTRRIRSSAVYVVTEGVAAQVPHGLGDA